MGIKERWKKFRPLPPGIRKRLDLLRPVFESEEILLAYLFGSLSRGQSGEDIDLAVFPGEKGIGTLRTTIYEILGTERIDLVNLKTAPPAMRFEVIKTGHLFYKRDDSTENRFEISAIKEFRDTAHLRNMQMRILEERTKRWF